jgi:hypothetical protein
VTSHTIEVPESTDLQTTGKDWLAVARDTVVASQEQLDRANDSLKIIKGMKAQVNDRLGPAVEAAHKAHKTLTSLRADLLEPFDKAEKAIKVACSNYVVAVQREAEKKRLAAEAEARKQAEEGRIARAEQLEKQGRTAEAHAEIAAPIVVAPPEPVAPPVAIPKGMVPRETWSARVDSLLALVQYVAANPSYIGLLEANQSALNDMARGLKGSMAIPGVVAVSSTSVAVR